MSGLRDSSLSLGLGSTFSLLMYFVFNARKASLPEIRLQGIRNRRALLDRSGDSTKWKLCWVSRSDKTKGLSGTSVRKLVPMRWDTISLLFCTLAFQGHCSWRRGFAGIFFIASATLCSLQLTDSFYPGTGQALHCAGPASHRRLQSSILHFWTNQYRNFISIFRSSLIPRRMAYHKFLSHCSGFSKGLK